MVWFVLLLLLMCFNTEARTVSLNYSGLPERIEVNTPFTINVSFVGNTCLKDKPCYLRAAFYKEDTTNYFGMTKNDHGDWVDLPQLKSEYYEFSTENGSYSGNISVKGNSDDGGFLGAGNYNFKLGRYTSASSSASWSDWITSIYLDYTPPPTPTGEPRLAPTTTPTPTPVSTPRAEASSAPTGISTPRPTIKPTPVISPISSPSGQPQGIAPTLILESPVATVAGIRDEKETDVAPWMIIGGSMMVVSGILPLMWKQLQ